MRKNSDAARQSDIQKLKQTISSSERRIKTIDKAIEGLFETNISGKITDERFVKMTANYEKKQRDFIELTAENKRKLQAAEQNKVDLRMLLKCLREYTEIRQLTPKLVNTLVQRIEVHSKDKSTKCRGRYLLLCCRIVLYPHGKGSANVDGRNTAKS